MKVRVFVLMLVLVTAGMLVAEADAQSYPPGVISCWRLNEGSGAVAHDSVDANHGTVTNPNWSATCVSGSCIESSPRGATYVTVPNSPSLNVTRDQLTVEAWVYPFASSASGGQGNGAIVVGTDSYGLNVGGWWRGAFQFTVTTTENGWVSATSPGDFAGGSWYHMVGVYDGTQLRLYVNGVLTATIAQHGVIAPFSSPLWIGRFCGGASGIDGCFYGQADEVAVYNRVLTEAEIQQHYLNGLNGLGCGPLFNWTGFMPPVNNPPTFNPLTAGKAVGVKFSLGGDQGMAIFPLGSPTSRRVDCITGAPVDTAEDVVPSGMALLTYKPTGIYQYAWKTSASWAGTCRELNLRLTDGTEHKALFKF